MTWRVQVSPCARDDLIDIRDRVAVLAQDYDVADRYVGRMEARIATLAEFPNRGTPRPDLGLGVRSIPFERRRVIFYRVDADKVLVLRVLDGARDLGAAFD